MRFLNKLVIAATLGGVAAMPATAQTNGGMAGNPMTKPATTGGSMSSGGMSGESSPGGSMSNDASKGKMTKMAPAKKPMHHQKMTTRMHSQTAPM